MKILHINSGTSGGAALCAFRISDALKHLGIDCKVLVANNNPIMNDVVVAEKDVDFWYSKPVFGKIKHLLMRNQWFADYETTEKELENVKSRLIEDLFLSSPLTSYKSIINHPSVKWADIIHLHWVSGMIDYPSFFKRVKKPIVWTLHDMNPAVGAMHFMSANTPIPESLLDLENKYRRIKRKAVLHCSKGLHVVAISEKMKQIIESSDVLKGFPVTLIHNGVDINVFRPIMTRKRKHVFLFSSFYLWDKRKGLKRVLDALEKIDIPNKELIVIGNNDLSEKYRTTFPVTEVGFVEDQQELAKIYSSVVFFINASYEEGFAQTPLEAMACGTPVISTPCSGAADLIRPFNGVVCKGFDSDAIAEGIMEAVTRRYNPDEIRQYIIDNFRYEKIAEQYKQLYESVLG